MKKRFLAVILALALALCLLPTAAFAATTYDIWVGGTQVTGDNMTDVLGDGKVSYTPADGTTPQILHLNGANITGAGDFSLGVYSCYSGIYTPNSITIELTGNNTVDISSHTGKAYNYAICCDGGDSTDILKFTGSGTLTAKAGAASVESAGVYGNSAITIDAGTTVKAFSGSVSNTFGGEVLSAGFYSSYALDISGTLEATGANAETTGIIMYSCGVYGSGGVTVESGGVVKAAAGTANDCSFGMQLPGADPFTIKQGASVTADGYDRAFHKSPTMSATAYKWRIASSGTYNFFPGGTAYSYATTQTHTEILPGAGYEIWVGGTQVTSDNMTDVLGDGKVSYTPADGTTAQILHMNGANITAANDFDIFYSTGYSGIYTNQSLTIELTGSNIVDISANTGKQYNFTICCDGGDSTDILKFTGSGTLTAKAGAAKRESAGVYGSSTTTIDAGTTLKAFGASVSDASSNFFSSEGLYSSYALSISGTLEATGESAANTGVGGANSYGICSAGNMAIESGGVVKASAGTAEVFSYGVYIQYDTDSLTIQQGASVTADGEYSAFNKAPTVSATTYKWRNASSGAYTYYPGTAYTWDGAHTYVSIVPALDLDFTDDAAYDVPAGTAGTAITPINVSPGVSGGTTPYTFSLENAPLWLSINSSTGAITGTRPASAQAATTATVKVTDSATSSDSKAITIAVGAVTVTPTPPSPSDPTITDPTVSKTVTVAVGNTGTMSVTAQNATGFQWYINRNDSNGFVAISGATSASYTTGIVALNYDGYQYYCIVSGAAGTTPVTSPIFTLNVIVQPDIPATGDNSQPGLWIGIAMLSAAGLAGSVVTGRKRRRGEN